MKQKPITHIGELTPDPKNARAHNPRNIGMIVDSLQAVGAGRSIVVDEDGRVLAGNGTIEAAAEAGIEKVLTVDVDGDTIVAVRRTGLSEDQKLLLAAYDNRTAELATWSPERLAGLVDSSPALASAGLWSDTELSRILSSVPLAMPLGDTPDIDLPEGDEPEYEVAPSQVRMVQLFFDLTTHPQFMSWVGDLMSRYQVDSVTDAVYEAVKRAHDQAWE